MRNATFFVSIAASILLGVVIAPVVRPTLAAAPPSGSGDRTEPQNHEQRDKAVPTILELGPAPGVSIAKLAAELKELQSSLREVRDALPVMNDGSPNEVAQRRWAPIIVRGIEMEKALEVESLVRYRMNERIVVAKAELESAASQGANVVELQGLRKTLDECNSQNVGLDGAKTLAELLELARLPPLAFDDPQSARLSSTTLSIARK